MTQAAHDLNPTQRATLAAIRLAPEDRPAFDPDIGTRLEAELIAALDPVATYLTSEKALFVSKHALTQVHACERRYMAELDTPFGWSAPLARGSVAHKAIELLVHWRHGEPTPLALVDEALEVLTEQDTGLAGWLNTCSERERAELRALANERVAMFMETFPPLENAWRPVTEARLRVELFGGGIVLQGRIDLSLGTPIGSKPGKAIIDFKTGSPTRAHLDDLRFYALLETIRMGTPPFLVADLYLDSGRPETEVVTEGMLEAALVRTAEGIVKMVELREGLREASPSPSRACRWCPVLETCEEGLGYLHAVDEGEYG